MNSLSFIDSLVRNYDNLVKYPILSLYVQDRDTFLSNFIIIDEDISITICDRISLKMLVINKSAANISKFTNKVTKAQKVNKKIFSIGSFEIYKTQIAII